MEISLSLFFFACIYVTDISPCFAAENTDGLSPDRTDGVSNDSSGNSKIESLQKQIAVEMKVKQGPIKFRVWKQ